MTVDQFVALGASVGACLSAIAAFLTIRQIARQREASYRPELALSRTAIRSTRDNEKALPTLWTESSNPEPAKAEWPGRRLVLAVRNVGLGTAKRVSVSWSFPIEEAVQNANQLAGVSRVLKYEAGRLKLHMDDKLQVSSMWRNQQRDSIDYIMPASIEREPTLLTVPHAYALVVSALVFFYAKTRNSQMELSLPVLRLDMSYSDISQLTHSESFEIRCEIASVNSAGEIGHAWLEHNSDLAGHIV